MPIGLHPTKQARSERTMERILDATAGLLHTTPFADISIRRIVAEADTSIGSFYGRFGDKDALLSALHARDEKRLAKRLRALERNVQAACTLKSTAEVIAAHFVATYGENPNLSRALFEFTTRAPEAPAAEALAKQRQAQYAFLVEGLLRYAREFTHPRPEDAVEAGLYFLTVTCRNRLFYPLAPQSRTLKMSKASLQAELARMLTGYLTSPDT